MASLTVEIVAEDHFVWKGQVRQIKAKIPGGGIGLLPGHTPLLATLDSGLFEVDPIEEQGFKLEITGGFLSLDSDTVVVVADDATMVKK